MYYLENELVKLTLDDHAAIIGLYDKRIEREYITYREGGNLFRLMAPNKTWDGRYADSAKADFPVVVTDGNSLTAAFQKLVSEDGKPLQSEIRIEMELSGDELMMCYSISNDDDDEFFSHIMFPIVSGLGHPESPMNLIMPEQSAFGDTRVQDPFAFGDGNHKDWTRGCNRKAARYPQNLSTAWIDYSDGQGGISFEQRSGDFDICDFGMERRIKKAADYKENNIEYLEFALQSYPNVKQGETRRSPVYLISLHTGDWHVPAKRHRQWLKAQVKSAEIPARFQESLGWHFYFMKQQDGTVYHDYNDLPRMAEAALNAGVNQIMVFGWYPAGHDNDYPYGYFANPEWGGEALLREKIAECSAMGCAVIPFFNGTLLDIATPEYAEYGYRWPVLGRTGEPYCGAEFSRANNDLAFRNASLETSTRNMTLLDICITAKEVQEWWQKTVARIVRECGFGNLQLDQIAHKSYVCYHPAHGHERPEYAYTKELQELLTKVRKIVREANSEGVMIGEGMSDLTAQYCDGFWNWHQTGNKPEIMRYSIPWMNYSSEVDANEYDAANICFAEKILMDLKIEGGDGILSDFPQFSEHLKKLSILKKKLPDSYQSGEYDHLEGIEIQVSEGILVRIYRNHETKRFAVVAANLKRGENTACFALSQSLCPDRMLYLSGNESKLSGELEYSIPLEAYQVAVIEGGLKEE